MASKKRNLLKFFLFWGEKNCQKIGKNHPKFQNHKIEKTLVSR
jgi:hypothetical protein